MKVSELRKAERAYEALRERIKRETVETLASETKEEQQRRIEELLLPRNYYIFWNYYLGASAGGGLGDKSCATFHQKSYEELVRHSSILQFRLWFRGAAKSLQTVVGNALALKQTGGLKFMLVVGINELRAKMLLSDLQAQLEVTKINSLQERARQLLQYAAAKCVVAYTISSLYLLGQSLYQ